MGCRGGGEGLPGGSEETFDSCTEPRTADQTASRIVVPLVSTDVGKFPLLTLLRDVEEAIAGAEDEELMPSPPSVTRHPVEVNPSGSTACEPEDEALSGNTVPSLDALDSVEYSATGFGGRGCLDVANGVYRVVAAGEMILALLAI
jgi:hypothetical protein